MSIRGRPRLADEEYERRRTICRAWSAEIKVNSGLSAKNLAKELGYGSGNDDADGRAWRALASGDRAPAPENFKRMTERAAKNGWLNPFGYLRYSEYWAPGEVDHFEVGEEGETEQHWRIGTLSRALLMLLAHAQKCGVNQDRFFHEARAELNRIESFTADLEENEIIHRARCVATSTVQALLDGPEYPETSLICEDIIFDGGYAASV